MNLLAIDTGLTVWTLLTFGALMGVLAKFAYRPIHKMLDEREKKIRDSLDQAARAAEEARQMLAQNAVQLESARDEARRIISESHRMVADMKKETQQNARKEADLIVQQARQDIDREVQRALGELKNTVSHLSVQVARQVITEELDPARHDKLADEFITQLKQTHAQPHKDAKSEAV
jgi:F-type H+-transporting ATPase subunit b